MVKLSDILKSIPLGIFGLFIYPIYRFTATEFYLDWQMKRFIKRAKKDMNDKMKKDES